MYIQGTLEGITLPLSMIVISELSPPSNRGRIMIIPIVFELLGFGYSVFLASIYLENGEWRIILFYLMFPAFLAFLGNAIFLKESPRYLLSQ